MHSSPQFILSIFWKNLLECGQLFSGEILWWGAIVVEEIVQGVVQLTGRQSFTRVIIQVVIFLDVNCPRTSKKKAIH